MDQFLREAIEIDLYSSNLNREDGFFLSQAWRPLIHDLKEWRVSYFSPEDGDSMLLLNSGFCQPVHIVS
jgi:hypothetical protein